MRALAFQHRSVVLLAVQEPGVGGVHEGAVPAVPGVPVHGEQLQEGVREAGQSQQLPHLNERRAHPGHLELQGVQGKERQVQGTLAGDLLEPEEALAAGLSLPHTAPARLHRPQGKRVQDVRLQEAPLLPRLPPLRRLRGRALQGHVQVRRRPQAGQPHPPDFQGLRQTLEGERPRPQNEHLSHPLHRQLDRLHRTR